MGNFLDNVNSPADLKNLKRPDLPKIAEEIREMLLQVISKTGGHLGSNLGIVELTLAMHYVFDSPTDKFVWDVGHQSYVHKLLTGRKERFDSLRQYEGLCGFAKREESEHDHWNVGHGGTSISAALAFAKAYTREYPSPDIVFSSPAVRAQALIEAYLRHNNTQDKGYFIDDALQEMTQGVADGKPRAAIYTPKVIHRINEELFDFKLSEGESLNEVADRMLTACRLSGTQLTIGHQRCCYTPQYDSGGNSSHRARLATVRSAEAYLLPSCIHTDGTHTIHMLLSLLINPRVSHLLAQVDGHSGHVYYGHVWRLQVLRSSPLNKVFMPISTGVSFPSTENTVAPITGFSLLR